MTALKWIPAALGDLSFTLLVVGVALGYTRTTPAIMAFGIATLGILIGVVATLCAIVMILRGGVTMQSGMALLGLPGALMLVYSLVSTRGAPMINDITTDRAYPPAFTKAQDIPANKGRDMGYPEAFKAQVANGYPDLGSLGMKAKRDDVYIKALNLAKSQPGWTVTANTITAKDSTIEGYAQSKIFGFYDDFVIRVTDAGDGAVVDMRSKSRDGKGDMGVNAARIRDFFARLRT